MINLKKLPIVTETCDEKLRNNLQFTEVFLRYEAAADDSRYLGTKKKRYIRSQRVNRLPQL